MKMKLMILMIALICCFCFIVNSLHYHSSSLLYSTQQKQEKQEHNWISKHFGTKRAYEKPSTTSFKQQQQEEEKDQDQEDQCRLINLNVIARHGSRYPTLSTIKQLKQLSKVVNETILKGTWKPKWQWNCSSTICNKRHSGHLCERGIKEMYGLGRRYSKKYKEILSTNKYNPTIISITTTNKPRTSQSATSFMEGIGIHGFAIETERKEELLRPFDVCERFQEKEQTKAMEFYKEQNRFITEVILPNLVPKLSKRTGISEEEIGVSEIFGMWSAAQYEFIINNNNNNNNQEGTMWSEIFDEEDVEELEYCEDILSYYKKSKGNEISYQIMKPLLKDIWENILQNINRNNNNNNNKKDRKEEEEEDYYSNFKTNSFKAKLRFCHAETLLPFLSLIGINKEAEPLLSTWTKEQRNRRVWRDSEMAPFSSNLAIAVYDCGNGNGNGNEKTTAATTTTTTTTTNPSNNIIIKINLNEKEIQLPGCSGGVGDEHNSFITRSTPNNKQQNHHVHDYHQQDHEHHQEHYYCKFEEFQKIVEEALSTGKQFHDLCKI